ncbi:MAG TPA: cyclase family protein [Methylomirabilota bacterium]|jgi:kynurenine formamidase|nr:cyclase family protein [Methylomirabilota bacterium]
MKLASILAASIIALVSFSTAFAQTDCTKVVPASPWGPNDETGATNRVTPAVTKAAAAEIREGKVIPMSYILKDGVPLFGSRFTKTILTATSLAPGGALGENQLTYMEDTWLSQSHVGTHLDGVGHIGRKDCYYNQTAMGKYINQNTMTKLGLEHLKSFATRGVLIDAVRVFQAAGKLKSNPACRKACLDKGTVITAADLQAGLKMYNVTLREGDIVVVHTGWGDLFEQFPAQNATFNSGQPGIGKDAATWLISQKIVAVGSDNWAVEVIPGEDPKEAFIVHNMLITDNGIHIIENVRTDLMADEAARTKRATFFFNMTVPRAYGLTGNFVGIDGIR